MSTVTEPEATTEKKDETKSDVKLFPASQFLDAYSLHHSSGGVIVKFTFPAATGVAYCVAPTTAKIYEHIAKTYLQASKLTEKEALLIGQKAMSEKK